MIFLLGGFPRCLRDFMNRYFRAILLWMAASDKSFLSVPLKKYGALPLTVRVVGVLVFWACILGVLALGVPAIGVLVLGSPFFRIPVLGLLFSVLGYACSDGQ